MRSVDRPVRCMKVLVADDEPVVRMMLARSVSQLGHHCFEANDGAEAWRAYLRVRPDVLITDRVMPGVDGLELCRRIRADAGPDYTFIVLVTGRGGADEVLEGVVAGADDYLVKPVDAFDLQVRLVTAQRVTRLHRELADATRSLQETNAALADISRRDGLTGVGNRRRFDEDVARLHASAVRRGESYSIALADVDNFKAYNDTHGHRAGDLALRAVAAALCRACRASDWVYRYGGEEFAIIYPDAALPEVLVGVERARAEVEAATAAPDGAVLVAPVTISAGVADRRPGEAASAVVEDADAALYAAKAFGRNCVVSAARPASTVGHV